MMLSVKTQHLDGVPAQTAKSPKHAPVHHGYAKPPVAKKDRVLLGEPSWASRPLAEE